MSCGRTVYVSPYSAIASSSDRSIDEKVTLQLSFTFMTFMGLKGEGKLK